MTLLTNTEISAICTDWPGNAEQAARAVEAAVIAKQRELLELALYALDYASDMTKPEGLSGCDCPICTVIPKIKEALK